jgi:hypothetical protein
VLDAYPKIGYRLDQCHEVSGPFIPMNLLQRIVLIVSFICITITAVFPPWVYVHYAFNQTPVERAAGHYLLFDNRVPEDVTQLAKLFALNPVEFDTQLRFFAMRVDATRLSIEVSVTLLLTLMLFFILNTKPPKSA